MSLKETFNKQGGMKLVKGYRKSGALFTAASEFVLLGKSRTALEILRLSASLKTKKKLNKKYGKLLPELIKSYDPSLPSKQSNKVFVCWFQGLENAPELVKRCYRSLEENLTGRELVLITSDNIRDYTDFPDYIYEKWERGAITHTHMTDLLRIELLLRHGGMWIDSTVLCTEKEENIPDYYFDSPLFFYQCLKPGRDGNSTYFSSWLMSARSNNRVLWLTRELCFEYWKKNNELINYFLFHYFLSIVLDYLPDDWKNIVPRDNATPHILLLRLFDEYDERLYKYITAQSPFHKLSYKFTDEDMARENTNYKHIING